MPVVALLALGGWTVLRPDGDGTGASAQGTPRLVEATQGTMAKTVTADGTIAAAESDDLSFTSSGTVTAVNVVAGQQITAGTVLATIDSSELAASVADAESTVAEAQAKLDDDEDAGASDAQIDADKSSLTSAQDRRDQADQDLAGAQLVADFDGTISAVNITVGEELASGTGGTNLTGSKSGSGQSSGTLGSGQPILGGSTDTTTSSAHIQMVSSSSYVVDLGFDDTDIDSIEVGQEASIALSTSSASGGGFFPGGGAFPSGAFPGGGAFPGAPTDTGTTDDATDAPQVATDAATVTGEVTEVGTIADASSGVASYPVTVAFHDDSGDFNVGATVSVDITIAEVADVVQIPSFAVTTSNGASTVTVSDDNGHQETREVTTGLTAGTMVEIVTGLKAGEQVVLATPGGFGQGGPPTGAAAQGGGG
jgi:macrolide-specific efflux system membrane fusion protein